MHLLSLKCSLIHLLLNSVLLGVVKSMNSETPPSSQLFWEVKTSGWVCKSLIALLLPSLRCWEPFRWMRVLVTCFGPRCCWVWGQFSCSPGRCIRWFPETLRKQQFPLRLADWFYTDVCSRALRRGQRAFSQAPSEGCTCTFGPTGALSCKISWWSFVYGSKVVFILCFIHFFGLVAFV